MEDIYVCVLKYDNIINHLEYGNYPDFKFVDPSPDNIFRNERVKAGDRKK